MSFYGYVFIVDDDAVVLDSLRMQLEAAGYAVATFHGAEDFLEICTPDTHGCIILDVACPTWTAPPCRRNWRGEA